MSKIPDVVREHMATIGAKGGKASRRKLSKAEARRMVEAREAKRKKKLPRETNDSKENKRWHKASKLRRKKYGDTPKLK